MQHETQTLVEKIALYNKKIKELLEQEDLPITRYSRQLDELWNDAVMDTSVNTSRSSNVNNRGKEKQEQRGDIGEEEPEQSDELVPPPKSSYSTINNLTWCQNKLLLPTKDNFNGGGGIDATKYHYSNRGKKRDVKLWFNPHFDTLFYQGKGQPFKSHVQVRNIKGIIFGAFSSVFSEEQEYVLNYEIFKKNTENFGGLQGSNPRGNRASIIQLP